MRFEKPFRLAVLPFLVISMFNIPMAGATSPPEQPLPSMVGGWSSVPVDARVRGAARYAVGKLHTRGARLSKINTVELQVVAGTNYRIDMTLTDHSKWQVVVWQKLDGSYELTSAKKLRKARIKKQ